MEEKIYNSQNFIPNKKKVKRPPIGTYIMLIIYSLYILVPFWIIFISSLKSIQEAAFAEFTWYPTEGVTWGAFKRVFESNEIQRGFINTLTFYTPVTLVSVFVSALASYGFAKMEWAGRNAIFSFLLLTMMIPGCVTMTATRLMYDTIGWIGTPLPVMIPGMFGGIGMVFFMRQYMKGIPDDLIGAAKIDGMSEIKIFLVLIIPLSVPALLTQGVLSFIGHYNDYLGALLYLIDEPLYTLQIAIKNMVDTYRTDLPAQMAACFLGMLPMLLIYLFLQNYILKGISMSSGLKG